MKNMKRKKPHPCKNRKDGAPNVKGRKPTSKTKANFKTKKQIQRRRVSGGLLRGALALLGDFGELAGFYVVDEAAHGDVLDIRVVLDAGDLAADILLDVLEGVKVRRGYGSNAGLLLEFVEELIVS